MRKATRYDLTFSNSSSEVGGGMISVNVVETALTTDEKVDILARPVIKIIENDQIMSWIMQFIVRNSTRKHLLLCGWLPVCLLLN